VASRDEEKAWQEIVANYGESPTWEGDAPTEPAPESMARPIPRPPDDPDAWRVEWAEEEVAEERFVPPEPPPVPLAEPRRLAAWAGLFVSPAVLLIAVVVGWTLPSWVSMLLVGWFIGGFLYLVAKMPRGPRDPGDDGARI
jgi:hypothetical protein